MPRFERKGPGPRPLYIGHASRRHRIEGAREAQLHPQVIVDAAVLRGVGAPAVKSDWFMSVSMHPELLRRTAVVFDVAGPAAPSEQFVPLPHATRSATV